MNAFEAAKRIEARALARLAPFLQDVAYKGRYVKTSKGALSRFLQDTAGDVLANLTDEYVIGLELKAEQRWTGNLFVEVYSNRSRDTPGWAYKIKCDFVLFYFLDADDLVAVHWPTLWCWLNETYPSGLRRLDTLQLVKQNKYVQMNDTWARLVPIKEVLALLPSCRVQVRQLELFGEHRDTAHDFIRQAVGL